MAENETPEEEKKGGGSKKLIIIGAIVVLLLAGAGAGAYFFLMSEDKPKDGAAEEEVMDPLASMPGPMITIDTFIVNILDENNTRYLKAAMSIECANDVVAQQVEARRPQVQDAILLLVGNKTYDELRDLQGKLQLRAELLHRLNQLLPKEGGIKHIYFTDFVVQ